MKYTIHNMSLTIKITFVYNWQCGRVVKAIHSNSSGYELGFPAQVRILLLSLLFFLKSHLIPDSDLLLKLPTIRIVSIIIFFIQDGKNRSN